MCKECGMAYSFYFGTQFHKAGCSEGLAQGAQPVAEVLEKERKGGHVHYGLVDSRGVLTLCGQVGIVTQEPSRVECPTCLAKLRERNLHLERVSQ